MTPFEPIPKNEFIVDRPRIWQLIARSIVIGLGVTLFLSGCDRSTKQNDRGDNLGSVTLLPARITGASMAPALNGESFLADCTQCRVLFGVDANKPPRTGKLTCPNCGYREILLEDTHYLDGLSISLLPREPKDLFSEQDRWRIFAFTHPEITGDFTVKRLVALPDEEVAIDGGDIFVNGKRLVKTLKQQLSTRIEVYRLTNADQDSHETNAANNTTAIDSSLVPIRLIHGSDWLIEGGEIQFVGPAKPVVSENADEAANSNEAERLLYRHVRCAPSLQAGFAFTAIDDNYGYNQGISRNLNKTTDLMFDVQIRSLGEEGELDFRLWDQAEGLQVRFDFESRQIKIQSKRLANSSFALKLPVDKLDRSSEERKHLIVSLFDSQLMIALDGQVLTSQPLRDVVSSESNMESKAEQLEAEEHFFDAKHPFAVSTNIHGLVLSEFRIYRDAFYLDPSGTPRRWETRVPMDSIGFFLGDNVPVSKDSRQWATFPSSATTKIWNLLEQP